MIEKLLQLCVLIVLLIVVTVVMSACLFASVTPSSTDNPLTPQTSGTSLPVLPTASTDEPAAELRQLSPMPSRPTKTPTSTPVADSTLQQQALPRYGILYYTISEIGRCGPVLVRRMTGVSPSCLSKRGWPGT